MQRLTVVDVEGRPTPIDEPTLNPAGLSLGYARTSTVDQSIEMQRKELAEAGCYDIYADAGVSGKTMQRPQLDACIRALQPGNTLVVWKLDRLGRSVKGLAALLADLTANDVGFRSLTEGIDTTTSTGRLMFHVISAVAEMERDLIRERTNAGLRAANGKGGRPHALEAHDVDLVRRRREEGWTLQAIADDRKVSRSTVIRALSESPQ